MKKQPFPVSFAAWRYLKQHNASCIGYSDNDKLAAIHDLCYPLNRDKTFVYKWQTVLNALQYELSKGCNVFEKSFFKNSSGRRARMFKIRG